MDGECQDGRARAVPACPLKTNKRRFLAVTCTPLGREAAPGADSTTWDRHEEGLDERLLDLLDRVHAGTYR